MTDNSNYFEDYSSMVRNSPRSRLSPSSPVIGTSEVTSPLARSISVNGSLVRNGNGRRSPGRATTRRSPTRQTTRVSPRTTQTRVSPRTSPSSTVIAVSPVRTTPPTPTATKPKPAAKKVGKKTTAKKSQRKASPAQSRASPARSRASPAQSKASPAKKNGNPGNGKSRASPAQSRASPAKKNGNPGNGKSRVSPAQSRASPAKKNGNPKPKTTAKKTQRKASPKVSPKSERPVISRYEVRPSNPKVSPSALKHFEETGQPRITHRQISERTDEITSDGKHIVNRLVEYHGEQDPNIFKEGRKAYRQPFSTPRPLKGVSTSVENLVDRVGTYNRDDPMDIKDRTIGEILASAVFDRYVQYLTDSVYGSTREDGSIEKGLLLTEEARHLLKDALESYILSLIQAGKVVTTSRDKSTLTGDEMMIVPDIFPGLI